MQHQRQHTWTGQALIKIQVLLLQLVVTQEIYMQQTLVQIHKQEDMVKDKLIGGQTVL